MQHALHAVQSQGEFEGGVGLQGHADAQAVQVHAGDGGGIGHHHRFGLHDAGERAGFSGGELQLGELLAPVLGPEGIVLFTHAGDELLGRSGPPELIGVGQEEADHGGIVEPGRAQLIGVEEGLEEGHGVRLERAPQSPR